jgi:hypothetical protein
MPGDDESEEPDRVKVSGLVIGAGVGVVVELAVPPAIEDAELVGVERPGLLRATAPRQGHHRGARAIEPPEQPRQLPEGGHGAP